MEEKNKGKNIKAGFPRFKSRDRYSSITYTQSGFRILENGHIWLSKIGEIRMFKHRFFAGEIKTVTVKRDKVGDWFITFTVQEDTEEPIITMENISSDSIRPVGIDLGLKSIITTSDGMHVAPPQYLRSSERKLKRAQKQLSRKRKGSGKREKARIKVAKIHRKIERQRDDFTHKLSKDLVAAHDVIVFEDLNTQGMIKNHQVAKSVADVGWNKIVQYTSYKAESAGKMVILIDPKYTSQKCSERGNIKHDLNLSDRIYRCDACGLIIDRDLNAAINIKIKGMQTLDESRYVGRGTPELTPVEIGSLPGRAKLVFETGSPLR